MEGRIRPGCRACRTGGPFSMVKVPFFQSLCSLSGGVLSSLSGALGSAFASGADGFSCGETLYPYWAFSISMRGLPSDEAEEEPFLTSMSL